MTESTNENAKTAAQLYTKLNGDIISTCFFESPDYGNGDYAKSISPGTKFTRITIRSLCGAETEEEVSNRLDSYECDARLVVVPDEIGITKIGGIFCRLLDKSYIAFLAFNSVGGTEVNHGLIFSGDIAERLFKYYESFRK